MIGSETPGVGVWERAHSRECRGLSDDVIAKQERQPKNGVDLNSLWESKHAGAILILCWNRQELESSVGQNVGFGCRK